MRIQTNCDAGDHGFQEGASGRGAVKKFIKNARPALYDNVSPARPRVPVGLSLKHQKCKKYPVLLVSAEGLEPSTP